MDDMVRGYLLSKNVILTYLSIVLNIVLGESSFKITLRFLTFFNLG